MGDVSYFLFGILVPLIFLGIFVYAFIDAARRPASDFGAATQNRTFWLVVLGIGALYYTLRLLNIYFPFGIILQIALIIGLFYYLGPERQAMGPGGWNRGGGRGRGGRGGW